MESVRHGGRQARRQAAKWQPLGSQALKCSHIAVTTDLQPLSHQKQRDVH